MTIMRRQEEKSFPRGAVETKPLTHVTNSVPSQKAVKRKVEKDLFSTNKEQSKQVKRKKHKKEKNEKMVWLRGRDAPEGFEAQVAS